jgi:hypothetical protein
MQGLLARGVTNQVGTTELNEFLMDSVAPRLTSYGLAEHDKVPPRVMWQRLKLSKEGVKFLTRARILEAENVNISKESRAAETGTSGKSGSTSRNKLQVARDSEKKTARARTKS